MKQIIKRTWVWFGISGTLMVVSIIALALWQLRLGIDFTGGSLSTIRFSQNPPNVEQLREVVQGAVGGDVTVQATDSGSYLIRFQDTTEATHQKLVTALSEGYKNEEGKPIVTEERFESIGSAIGQELRGKAFLAIGMVLLFIMLYIAWAFRKVSYPVKSWKYGTAAIIALFHDVIITLGIFAFLGKFAGVEVGLPFVAALLTIVGYSVHDSIVVFDRVRENLTKLGRMPFDDLVNRSVNETMARSINTSLTVLLTLVAIYFFGGDSIDYFALALLCGIFYGTYSSIFIASPLLVLWEKWGKGKV
jgi:preprotein translocase subunit SecF